MSPRYSPPTHPPDPAGCPRREGVVGRLPGLQESRSEWLSPSPTPGTHHTDLSADEQIGHGAWLGLPATTVPLPLLCPWAALGGRVDTAPANQERAPLSRRPRDLEAGVSPRTPLALVASRVALCPFPATPLRSGSKVRRMPACSRLSLQRSRAKTALRTKGKRGLRVLICPLRT